MISDGSSQAEAVETRHEATELVRRAMSEFDKLGVLSVAETPDAARILYHETVKIADRASAARP